MPTRPRLRLTLAASLYAMTGVVADPAAAACVQSGNSVTCSGSGSGFGSGVENGLTLTVQPDASLTAGPAQIAINLASGNTVINQGAIAVGDGGMGLQGTDGNTFSNGGAMTLGTGAVAMFTLGNNNVLSNAGRISSAADNALGIDALGSGNTVINSGTITLGGTASYGISANGVGGTIQNSGIITVGSDTGTNGAGVFLLTGNTLSNTGTIAAVGPDGVGVDVFGDGNTVSNRGIISATGTNGIALGVNGNGNQIVNDGTIKSGSNGYALFSFGTTGGAITNNGTLDGAWFFIGSGNSLSNAGLITITDPSTQLAAGNLAFGGTFTQTPGGTLALRVNAAGAHDGLWSDGQASLNGTLRAVLQPGLYQSTTTYTAVVRSSTSIAGQFANVSSPSAFFGAVATYNADTVDLTLTRYGFGAAPGETANQRAVGAALEAGYSTALSGSAATFYTRLLQAGSVRVLDQLSGEGASGAQSAALAAGWLFGQTMDSQMWAWRTGQRTDVAAAPALGYAEDRRAVASAFNALKAPAMAQPQWHAWAAGFGAGQSLSGNAATGSASLNDRIGGGAIGLDRLISPDLLMGVAVGGSSGTFSVDDRATTGRLDGAHVGAYAMQRFGAGYLSAQLTYSHFSNTTTRGITGIGPDEIAKASFGSDQLGGRLEVGRTFAFDPVAVTPFAAVQAARLWQAAYAENSSGVLGLSYAARGVSSLPLFLGVKFDGRAELGNGMIWTPYAQAAWVHEFEPTRAVTASLTTMALPFFTVEGARAASDAGRVELGSRLQLNRWSELSVRGTGEFSGLGQSYSGMGALRVYW